MTRCTAPRTARSHGTSHGTIVLPAGMTAEEALDLADNRSVISETADTTTVGDSAGSGPDPWAATSAVTASVYDDDLVDAAPRRRRWPVVLAAVVLAALIGGGAAWGWTASQPPDHEIPNLVGTSETEARQLVDDFGWKIDVEKTRQDGTEAGRVIETRPAFGRELEEGGRFVLVVSEGWTLAPVPTGLVGKPAAEVQSAIEKAQFVPRPSEDFSEEVEAGRVISVQEGLPAELPKRSPIAYVVSKGPEPRTIPGGLAGGPLGPAAAALEKLGLAPRGVEEFSDDVPAGSVIGTRPAEGESVARGATVDVVVSKGPDVVTVPTIKGRSLEQAVAALEAAGLTVGDLFGPAKGKPFESNPPASAKVRRGATVSIYLR